jgi:hypothetical protein
MPELRRDASGAGGANSPWCAIERGGQPEGPPAIRSTDSPRWPCAVGRMGNYSVLSHLSLDGGDLVRFDRKPAWEARRPKVASGEPCAYMDT